jgi:hypothetical protein
MTGQRRSRRPISSNTAIRRDVGNGSIRRLFTDFRPRGVDLADRAPDAHVDDMLCIDHNFFADAQSSASEYRLG